MCKSKWDVLIGISEKDNRENIGKATHNKLMGANVLELIKAWILKFNNHNICKQAKQKRYYSTAFLLALLLLRHQQSA